MPDCHTDHGHLITHKQWTVTYSKNGSGNIHSSTKAGTEQGKPIFLNRSEENKSLGGVHQTAWYIKLEGFYYKRKSEQERKNCNTQIAIFYQFESCAHTTQSKLFFKRFFLLRFCTSTNLDCQVSTMKKKITVVHWKNTQSNYWIEKFTNFWNQFLMSQMNRIAWRNAGETDKSTQFTNYKLLKWQKIQMNNKWIE